MGWTVRGWNPGWARFSSPAQMGPGAHPASCTMDTGCFPGVKSSWGLTLTPYPFQCHDQERVELYLYCPYGPYGLYRASVPVHGCTLPVVCHRLKLGGQTQYLNVKLSVMWCKKIENVSCGNSRFAVFECNRDFNEKLYLTLWWSVAKFQIMIFKT